ncbi:MAG: trigger factor [Micavibrio sp.]|nr:trigger factor [Micavibrio sp.]
MKIEDIKSEGLSRKLKVTIPANDIDERVDAKLKEVSQTIRMPGFRPGKVPMAMMKQRYGKAVLGEVLEAAVNESSAKAMEDKKIRPAMQPKIEVKSEDFGDGSDLVYTLAVDTLPEIKLVDFKGIKLEKPVAKVEAKDIDEALERIAANNNSTVEVTTKRAAKEGDTLVFDFDGRTADDDVHHDGMKAEGHNLKLGSGQFIPGFEEQLIGAKAGDTLDVKVSFPENYGAAHLAGRDAIFECTVHQIREDGEAQIDDEFAKSLGLEDVKALKAAVEEQLQKELDQQSRINLKKNLLDVLDEKHEFEIPAGMLEMEFDNIMQQIEMDRKQSGQDVDSSDEEKAEFREIANRRVRLGLVLSEVGQQNKITVNDQELQRAVITEAQKYPGQEKEVFDYYSKNPQALESLRAPLFEEKVVDYIVELADVKEKEISAEALAKLLEEEDEAPKKKAPAKKAAAKKADAKADDANAEKKPASKKAPAKKAAAKK